MAIMTESPENLCYAKATHLPLPPLLAGAWDASGTYLLRSAHSWSRGDPEAGALDRALKPLCSWKQTHTTKENYSKDYIGSFPIFQTFQVIQMLLFSGHQPAAEQTG